MPPDRELIILGLYVAGVAALPLSGFILEWGSWRRKGAIPAWRQAAEACGLTDVRWVSRPLGQESDLEGRSGEFFVRFEAWDKGPVGTRVVIGSEHHGAHGLTLRYEDASTAADKRHGAPEVELGDVEFDRHVFVEGPPALARAILDAETRPMVCRLLDGWIQSRGSAGVNADVVFEDGDLRVEMTARSARELGELLPGAVRALLKAARRLTRPDDIAARLARNIRVEPIRDVRLQGVLTLAREYPEHPATRETLRAALKDKDGEIRLRAAMALGEEGRETLLTLASNERRVSESRSARAIAALGEHLPFARAQAILHKALGARRLETAAAVLEALGRSGHPETVAAIAGVLSGEKAEVAVAAACALGASGLPAAEPPLIEALARDDDALRVAAVQALGRVASAGAVLPLKEAIARHPDQGLLQRTARQAIAEIQSRLTGAVPGQLSLTDAQADQAGQLSLADGEAGRLSLAEDDAGRDGRGRA